MVHSRMQFTRKAAAAAWFAALAVAPALAADPGVVWVDNESFGFASCGDLDALPGSQDPKELMNALRERGLVDAARLVRARGLGGTTVTLTPVSGAMRCEDAASSMVFRVASFDRASGRAWSANLVTRLPAGQATSARLRSTR